jgi:hypothetical protein
MAESKEAVPLELLKIVAMAESKLSKMPTEGGIGHWRDIDRKWAFDA